MPKKDSYVLALHSDTHAGNSLGLLNPDITCEVEDTNGNTKSIQIKPSEWQKYLWELYTSHIDKAFEISGSRPLYVAHLGDATQGLEHIDNLISNTIFGHIQIACGNADAWFSKKKQPVAYWQIYGTGVHVFGEGSSERLIVERMKLKYPKTDFKGMYHAEMNFRGALIDLAHHGPAAGRRKWLEGNSAGWMTKSMMLEYIMMGKTPPHLVGRGHVHEYRRNVQTVYTGDDREFETQTIILPSYCGLGDYGQKATRSTNTIQNGMVIVEFEDGKIIRVTPLVQTVDLREVIEIL